MAYSPSPHPSALSGSMNPRYRVNRLSPSPPQQTVNKRDKKRMAMTDRLAEISNNFAENRDALYRERLRKYQIDIVYINNAQLYDNKALDENPSFEDPNTSAAASTQGSVRTAQLQSIGNGSIPTTNSPGKHAATFIHEVNDALEEKDARLVEVTVSQPWMVNLGRNVADLLQHNYNFVVEQLQKDYLYSVAVAEEEHKRLTEALRVRLIANVQAKKTSLQRDKEKLDIADTNALLYHPNQFSINSAGSPGGPQSNRKTRHTRHRLEAEELDIASAVNNKRKRKGPSDVETGSPVRDVEIVNGHKGYEVRQEYQQMTAPLYSIDKLFTEKELNAHLQAASLDVLADLQAVKRRKLGDASGLPTADSSEPDDNADGETVLGGDGVIDNGAAEAPAMERNATNQSYHATRSTRTQNLINGATRQNLGELAGRQAAAELIGTYQKEKKKDDDYNRAPPLSDQETEHDFALMAKAMKALDQRRKSDASLLDEVAGERPDHVCMPEIVHSHAVGTNGVVNGTH